jgi:hypothetical protein
VADVAGASFESVATSRRPCHYRAIHNGPDRSPADNHGQHHSGLDQRRSLPSQVTTPPDLALQAGNRSVFASNQAHTTEHAFG